MIRFHRRILPGRYQIHLSSFIVAEYINLIAGQFTGQFDVHPAATDGQETWSGLRYTLACSFSVSSSMLVIFAGVSDVESAAVYWMSS
jgi:hypothetical protein